MGNLIDLVSRVDELDKVLSTFSEIPDLSENVVTFYFSLFSKKVVPMGVFDYAKKKYVDKIKSEVKLIDETSTHQLFTVYLQKIKDDEGKSQIRVSGKALCLFDKKQHLAIFITDEKSDFVKNALSFFLNKLYPYSKNLFIPSTKIESMLEELENQSYSVSPSFVSIKQWWKKEQKIGPSDLASSEIFYLSNVSAKKFLEELKKKKSLINSIKMEIKDNKNENVILKVLISRKGFVKYISGFYPFFKENILLKLLEYRFDKLEIFENKQREINRVNPISIIFDINLPEFDTREVVRNFSNVLHKNRDILLNEYHSGNPYFHSQVTDYSDGSTYEVLFADKIIEERKQFELTIIPQYACSEVALSKVVSFLFVKFGEGKIANDHAQ